VSITLVIHTTDTTTPHLDERSLPPTDHTPTTPIHSLRQQRNVPVLPHPLDFCSSIPPFAVPPPNENEARQGGNHPKRGHDSVCSGTIDEISRPSAKHSAFFLCVCSCSLLFFFVHVAGQKETERIASSRFVVLLSERGVSVWK
jgi:hypothetical protein